MSAPALPKPDALPVPELKNPDDGLAVEFPKPGAAGMSMIWIVPPCKAPMTVASMDVAGPPMSMVTVGPVTVDDEMLTGPR
ncbi:hypothetical protein LAUMK7_03557 [Mycobacterium kansasii]|nr:hypothetical protein LAUMK22_02960 [Mycobacterium kansasii]VAZ67458.1 hypothetical protein LAUMK40_03597 [Mycobacterium kansasii]VAZ76860.1 hypothetical protein LAUMK7_03557 [Mycobacterium kansasii]